MKCAPTEFLGGGEGRTFLAVAYIRLCHCFFYLGCVPSTYMYMLVTFWLYCIYFTAMEVAFVPFCLYY